ncbi:MAG: hypothetical protein RQ982_00025 [Gammaproteobacteria bacterium]|nr:hypothetical protein [Gammaproteobacteria bacterium]
MNENSYNMLFPILKDFAFFTSFALFFVSLVIGLFLLIQPSVIIRFNNQVAKKFSLRRVTKFIETPNDVDHLFYRHHRILGIVIMLTSAYVLYYFIAIYDTSVIADYLKNSSNAITFDILINTIRLFMLISSVAILLLGVAIYIRPSQIKLLEAWANRWISTRQAARSLSVEHDQLNQLIYRHPRLTGLLIVSFSLYSCIFLFFIYTQ